MRLLIGVLLLAITPECFAAPGDWNQFRGPRGDGTSTAKGLPVQFSEGAKSIVWKTPIPGRAWSSPVVWDNQVWVTNAPELQNPTEDKPKPDKPIELSAVCVDLNSGKVIHNVKVFDVETPQFTHVTNSYASCTPWIEDGRIYVHFGSYGTACLDTRTGEKIWERRDLPCDHFRGPGSSPIVYDGLLILCFDGYDYQYIAALDTKTGKTVWKKDREIDYGTDNGDAKKAYSTPSIIKVDGRDLLISPFAMATIAYEPKTGERVWTFKHGGMNAAARPLYGDGIVYLNAGDASNALVAVRAGGQGDITDSNLVWKTGKQTPKRSSQLLLGDLYFMMNDGGVASCLDAKTGDLIWTERLPGAYWSSPLHADGLIYCCSQEGHVQVFKADRKFELVAENKLDDGFNASPAVAGQSLILRSKSHLYRIEKSPDEKWGKAIQEMEDRDAKSPPPKGGIVFVGSSSIRLWKLDQSFPDLRAINRGFGGSQIRDSVHFVDRLVLKHEPRTVVFYAGDNDIAAGRSADQVVSDFTQFAAAVHERLPQTRVLFISIKPSLARWKLVDRIRAANQGIATLAKQQSYVGYVDVFTPMLGADGKPRPELFAKDGLHLNDEGYQVWATVVRPSLIASTE